MRYNNNNNKNNMGGGPRRGGGGGMRRHSGGHHHRGNNVANQGTGDDVLNQRPRRNWRALQENYLNKARDAMSQGDRVMAEYWLQHADHYFREYAAFNAERNARIAERPPQDQSAPQQQQQERPAADPRFEDRATQNEAPDEAPGEDINPYMSNNTSALPAFLTRSGENSTAKPPAPPPASENDWDN